MVPPSSRYPTAATRLWNLRPWSGNRLLRGGDRFLAWLVCGAVLIIVAMVPAAVAVGVHSHAALTETAAAAAAERSRVPATLQEPAPAPTEYNPYPATRATWSAAGTQHTGTVHAPPGCRRGEVVDIWVNRSGAQTAAPPDESSVLFDAALLGILAWGGAAVLVCGPVALAAHRIRIRQLERWEIEWARLHAGF